jgi:hypothetical protein
MLSFVLMLPRSRPDDPGRPAEMRLLSSTGNLMVLVMSATIRH